MPPRIRTHEDRGRREPLPKGGEFLLPDGVERAYRVVMNHAALIAALFPTVPEKRRQEAEERLREYLSFVTALAERLVPDVPAAPPLTAGGTTHTLEGGRTFTSTSQDTES